MRWPSEADDSELNLKLNIGPAGCGRPLTGVTDFKLEIMIEAGCNLNGTISGPGRRMQWPTVCGRAAASRVGRRRGTMTAARGGRRGPAGGCRAADTVEKILLVSLLDFPIIFNTLVKL
jgi:hypothetical protein